ncbi:MAG TPA: HD domain-containing phosphohydrolase [Nitrospiria bacterium]|nr:HD domain-containing phosphohydrolase [Nitrospiria bacterium]
MAGELILVVDDEPHIQRLCAEILQAKGYQVKTVTWARDALELSKTSPFDLLVTDLVMPEMDGLQLIWMIREHLRELPTIVMTGQGTMERAVECLKLGVQGFVMKPFSGAEMVTAVEDALTKTRLRHENMRYRLLMPLFEVSRQLLSELNMSKLIDELAAIALVETHSDGVSFLLKEEGDFVAKREEGIAQVSPPAVNDQIRRWLKTEKDLLMLTPVMPGDPLIRTELQASRLSSVLCMPLVTKGRVAGGLVLYKREGRPSFTQVDIELLAILCGQAAIAIENIRLFEDLQRTHFEAMKALAQAIEAKDQYTRGHCDRTVEYAMAIAEKLSLTDEEKKALRYAAFLHDVGKIGIHESILAKEGRLTEEEYRMMQSHPSLGADIIKGVEFLEPVVPLVYHHQERYDGKGYPAGLVGEAIPRGARIVAVLDTFDAMTSDRPYRKAMPLDRALAELRRCAGSQFDPQVVEAFIAVLEERVRTDGGATTAIPIRQDEPVHRESP